MSLSAGKLKKGDKTEGRRGFQVWDQNLADLISVLEDSAAVGLESAEWNCPFNREKNIHLKRSDMKMSQSVCSRGIVVS